VLSFGRPAAGVRCSAFGATTGFDGRHREAVTYNVYTANVSQAATSFSSTLVSRSCDVARGKVVLGAEAEGTAGAHGGGGALLRSDR